MDFPKNEFEQPLPCDLTRLEIELHSDAAAELEEALLVCDKEQERLKHLKNDAKVQGDAITAQLRSHLRMVRTKSETRQVACYEVYSLERDRMETFREDLYELLSFRAAEPHEKQGQLRIIDREETPDERDTEDRKPAGS